MFILFILWIDGQEAHSQYFNMRQAHLIDWLTMKLQLEAATISYKSEFSKPEKIKARRIKKNTIYFLNGSPERVASSFISGGIIDNSDSLVFCFYDVPLGENPFFRTRKELLMLEMNKIDSIQYNTYVSKIIIYTGTGGLVNTRYKKPLIMLKKKRYRYDLWRKEESIVKDEGKIIITFDQKEVKQRTPFKVAQAYIDLAVSQGGDPYIVY